MHSLKLFKRPNLILFIILTTTLFLLSSVVSGSAFAQTSCANVRCAGTCTDTLSGPVCEMPRPGIPGKDVSCANVRCPSGTICAETTAGLICEMQDTSPTITCANVRCAGTCTDTATGPVCGSVPDFTAPPLSCASVTCTKGMGCEETPSGPLCVSKGALPPKLPPIKDWKKRRHTHNGRVCYSSHWQPWSPSYNQGSTGTHSHPHTHPHGGHDHHDDGHHNGNDNPQMCPMVYQPVCAEKVVQCVKAPCPSQKRTFGNACEATRDGYTVVHDGVCN